MYFSKKNIPRNSNNSMVNTAVPRIHAKIALNVVTVFNLVQMKLLSCISKIELGAFRKFLPFVCMPISPCIMCVQYRRGAQYRGGYSVPWGIS